MPSNRIACNFLIQSKVVANYKKPREGGVGLTPGKKITPSIFVKFLDGLQKPLSTVTTHCHKRYDNHTPKFNCIVCEVSNIFISRIIVVV